MKRFIKSQLEKRAGTLFSNIRSLRNRRYFRKAFAEFQTSFQKQLITNGNPIVVQAGPFQGMRYFNEVVWGCITPKWLGSYEAELHTVMVQILRRDYDTIIDVGCAEGYYAVGLALAFPKAKVIAFDTDFISRRQLARLAALNHLVDRIEIRAWCQHQDLTTLASPQTLVVCDIEGFETQLLDPVKATGLLRSDILVEVHESPPSSSATEELLLGRFTPSHRIERISSSDRAAWIDLNLRPLHPAISSDLLRKATEENRGTGFVWLWMQALSK